MFEKKEAGACASLQTASHSVKFPHILGNPSCMGKQACEQKSQNGKIWPCSTVIVKSGKGVKGTACTDNMDTDTHGRSTGTDCIENDRDGKVGTKDKLNQCDLALFIHIIVCVLDKSQLARRWGSSAAR